MFEVPDWLKRAAADVATGGLYEGYKYFGDKAAEGYNTAAKGAALANQQAQAFSEEQWKRMMEGLQGAKDAYGPAQNWFNQTYGQNVPGAAEKFYSANQDKFQQPGAQQSAYTDYRTWAQNPANNETQNGATRANQYLNGPTASSQAWGSMGQGLQSYSGPQAGQNQYGQNWSQYNMPGTAEAWQQANAGAYSTPMNSQNTFAQYGQQLAGPGRSEQFQVNAPNTLQSMMGDYRAFSQGPNALQSGEAENKGYIRNANQASDYYQSQLGQLSGPGQYEQFVSQDISGTNPELERARMKSSMALNQDLARRGHFDSGGANVALGEMQGSFMAQDYQNRAQRAKDAQAMQLGRIGQGGQLAGQVSGLDINRGTALAGMDQMNEQAQLARMGLGLQAGQAASGEALAGQQLGLQAAGQADNQQLARLQGMSQMGSQADQLRLQQLAQGQGAANDSQSQMLARLMGGQNAANSVDQTKLASDQQALQRMLASFNMAQGADSSGLQRAQQLFAQGQGVDQSNLARFGMMGDQAQALDQSTLAKLIAQGGAAQGAQSAEAQRFAQSMAAQMGISNGIADQYGKFYGLGGELSGDAQGYALNALMAMYGLQGQGQMAQAEVPFKIGGTVIDGYKAYNGAKG
jgi:hypothetical protein